MLLNDDAGDTSDELNAETAAPDFEAYLSSLGDEDQAEPESPPTPQDPGSESESEEEAGTEQADADDDESVNETEAADESEEAPAVSVDPETVKYKVKVNGEEREETLAEILKGYSRTADYTRKTQELAEQRKAHEAEAVAVRGERQMYAQRMQMLEQALRDATPQEPDWDKVQRETPDQFPALWAQWSAHKDRMNAISAERQKADEALQRDQAAQRQEYLKAEQTKLLEALPEWKDAETAKTAKTAMVGYVKNLGYSVEEISRVSDHRLLVLIDKAMKYDAAQAKRPKLVQQITKVKAATPGPATPPVNREAKALQTARQRLAKSGSRDDAAAAFEAILD